MVGNMVTTWQERMLDCTGLPKNVIAPADTINLVVIDRHYSAGRSFLNLPDVISHLQVGCCTATAKLLTRAVQHALLCMKQVPQKDVSLDELAPILLCTS